MRHLIQRILPAVVLAASSFAFANVAMAESFPVPGKPLRIVVPFPPGGQTDTQARAIAQKLQASLGITVIVENKPGASTLIGTREVRRAEPDGHTILYTITTFFQLPHLHKTAPYDPFKEFTPITTGSRAAFVLTAHTTTPFNTLAELIAFAKANPGKLSYASPGIGTSGHLEGEMLKRLAGIDIVHIPYKGTAEALKDHLAGIVQLSFDGPPTAMAGIQTGRIKYLAWAAETRASALPDIPTFRESGYDIGRWGYLWFIGPAGMPTETVTKLYAHLEAAIRSPDLRQVMGGAGSEVSALAPEETRQEAKRLFDYWGGVINELGVKVD
jgi:tripartite-type tricarboxylate transporter receptor subunit TctC